MTETVKTALHFRSNQFASESKWIKHVFDHCSATCFLALLFHTFLYACPKTGCTMGTKSRPASDGGGVHNDARSFNQTVSSDRLQIWWYVCGHNILVKFDNKLDLSRHFRIMAFDLSKICKIGFVRSLSQTVSIRSPSNLVIMCLAQELLDNVFGTCTSGF